MGETNFDFAFSEADLPKAIAIQINGNDHFIRDTIVFSSKIGLEVNGAADYISGGEAARRMRRAPPSARAAPAPLTRPGPFPQCTFGFRRTRRFASRTRMA